jgi:hypothetical protein
MLVHNQPSIPCSRGTTALAETLAHAPEDPAAIVEAIDDALRDFQASTAIDDRALLVLRHG